MDSASPTPAMWAAGLGTVELEDDGLGDGVGAGDRLVAIAPADDGVARALEAVGQLAEHVAGAAGHAEVEHAGQRARLLDAVDRPDDAVAGDEEAVHAALRVARAQVGLVAGEHARALPHDRHAGDGLDDRREHVAAAAAGA